MLYFRNIMNYFNSLIFKCILILRYINIILRILIIRNKVKTYIIKILNYKFSFNLLNCI